MKLALTLVVRDEADVLEANLAFHLAAGVDVVIATDHGSDDGTREILDAFASSGRLYPFDEPGLLDRSAKVTEMARFAAGELGADWVIDGDADEFWWPRGGSLKEVLAVVPRRFGSVRGMWRHFVPRPAGGEPFAERMTIRLCSPATQPDDAFGPRLEAARTADRRIGGGNREASGRNLVPLAGWYPIDVLHFPLRSLEQCERKYADRARPELESSGPPDPRRLEAYEAGRAGRLRELYESQIVGDDAVEAGERDGTLVVDTRLRDALRAIRAGSTELDFTDPVVDCCYVSDVAALEEQGASARAERRIASLERRVGALEAAFPTRIRARLSRVARR